MAEQQNNIDQQLKGWKFEIQGSDSEESEGEAKKAKPSFELRRMSAKEQARYSDGFFAVTHNCWADIATGHPTTNGWVAAYEEALHYAKSLGNQAFVEFVAEKFIKVAYLGDLRRFLQRILEQEGFIRLVDEEEATGLPQTEGQVSTASKEQLEALGNSSGATDQAETISSTSPAPVASSTTAEQSAGTDDTSHSPSQNGTPTLETPIEAGDLTETVAPQSSV